MLPVSYWNSIKFQTELTYQPQNAHKVLRKNGIGIWETLEQNDPFFREPGNSRSAGINTENRVKPTEFAKN